MILSPLLLPLLSACQPDDGAPQQPGDDTAPGAVEHPTLMVTAAQKPLVLERLERAPYDAILAEIQDRAAREPRQPEGDTWDHSVWSHNADIAQNSALLAWLLDDEEAAAIARDALAALEDDFHTNQTWDVNIRMPHVLMGYTNALDLLLGADAISEEEAAAAGEKITTINREFYERYVETDTYRLIALYPSQNNHPIRTAAAIGYVALAFPDDPDAQDWADWAFSELDYLWGPGGQYVQPDGGVSEGPFYYGFAWGVSTALFIAAENAMDPEMVLSRDCTNRQTVEPWAGHGCTDGEAFTFDNPLYSELYRASVDWSLSLRMPAGHRPPLADAYFNPFNGAALLTAFVEDAERYRWDWESNPVDPLHMTHGADLLAHHLVYFDDTVPAAEPPWTSRILPDAGNAIFRSGWGEDALWGLLVAEHGSARMTLHDHVDGTSFTVAAYGDYLLIDPGYYKPSSLDNARTAHADAHNVILIDGQGAPDKGLLTDFGDADAFLVRGLDAGLVDHAEAQQRYEETDIQRSFLLVRDRYFVVADRLTSAVTAPRRHAWRLHLGAGRDLGGTVSLREDGADIAQASGSAAIYLAATAPGLEMEEVALDEELTAPHVHEYDRSRTVGHHAVIEGAVEAAAPGFLAVVAPHRTGAEAGAEDGPLDVQAVAAAAGQAAWVVETAAGPDLVLARSPGADEALTLADGRVLRTDAEVAVLSLEDAALTLRVGGSYLSLDGAARDGEVVE